MSLSLLSTGLRRLAGGLGAWLGGGPTTPAAQSFTADPQFSDDGGTQPLLGLDGLTFSASLPSGWTRVLELQFKPVGVGSPDWTSIADWNGTGTTTIGVWCVEFDDGDKEFTSCLFRARVKLSKSGESDVIGDWQGLLTDADPESSFGPTPDYPSFVDLNWKRSISSWNVYRDNWLGVLSEPNTQATWRMYDDAESIVTTPYTIGINDFTDTLSISPTVPVTDNVLITYKLMRLIYNSVDDTNYWSSEQTETFIPWSPAQLANHSLEMVMDTGTQFTDTAGTTLCGTDGEPVRRVTPRYGSNGQTTSGLLVPRFSENGGQYYFNGTDNYLGTLDADIVLLPLTSDPAWTLIGKFTHGAGEDSLLGHDTNTCGLFFESSGSLSFYDDGGTGGAIASFTPSNQDYVFWLWKEASSDTLHCRVYSDAATVAGSSDSMTLTGTTTFSEMGECTGLGLFTDNADFKFKQLFHVSGSAITPSNDVGVSMLDWMF